MTRGQTTRTRAVGHFVLRAAAFMALLAAADRLLGAALRHLYFRQTSGPGSRITRAIDRTDAEVLIFGSSRANHSYKPATIRRELGRTCYNAGVDGQGLVYDRAVEASALRRYRPKLIVLDLSPHDVDYRGYERLTDLLPYCKDHPACREAVLLRGPFERLKLASAIYPFNSHAVTIAYSLLRPIAEQDGYVPLSGEMAPEPEERDPGGKVTPDPNNTRALEAFVSDARLAGAGVVFVTSPVYRLTFNADAQDFLNGFAAAHDVPFWDYSQDPAFRANHRLFRDRLHLNDRGADLFSRLIARRLGEAGLLDEPRATRPGGPGDR